MFSVALIAAGILGLLFVLTAGTYGRNDDSTGDYWLVPVFLVFAGGGVAVFWYLGLRRTFVFDRKLRTFTATQPLPFCSPTRRDEIPLKEIASARVAVRSDSDGDTYSVELILRDGRVHPLMPIPSSGLRHKKAVADAINRFLGQVQPGA